MLAAADLGKLGYGQAPHEKHRPRAAGSAWLQLVELLHVLYRKKLRRDFTVNLQRRIAVR